jgi:guanylate kinase
MADDRSKFSVPTPGRPVLLIIVAAPSGAGKSSFVERACREISDLRDTVTYTTRSMRAGESEGQPYHFVTPERFQRLAEDGFFVEWARVHENLYGTPWYQLREAWAEQKVVIMDVDIQGAATFKRQFDHQARSIFILPPSIDELRRRVIRRDGKVPDDLEVRMRNAAIEIGQADRFDHRLVNDEFEPSYAQFKKIIEELVALR